MPTFTPTEEQTAILALARDPSSLLINALAGAAKTSTLCLLAAKLPLVPTLCLAFNKRIADEMQKRMPSHIQCSTMNSLGHRAWGKAIGKRLTLEQDKSYNILKGYMDGLPAEQKKRLAESFASILRAARMAKSAGFIPSQYSSLGKTLCSEEDLITAFSPQIDVDPDDEFMAIVSHCLQVSIAKAYEGVIDFDDQIYMSTLFAPGAYTRFPIVMVDEAQDLSPLNHETLSHVVGDRLIAVGDPFQSIYAFRGADTQSMPLLRERFSCKEMSLSTSFRCPKLVVERARFRAPLMQYPTWAEEGIVRRLDEGWTHEEIPDYATIICRNNAPLLSLALRLLRAGRGIKLVGFDIGANLVKTLRKLGVGGLPREAVIGAINAWRDDQLAKAHEARKASINDRASCLMVFAEQGQTLDEAVAFAERIFASAGTIQLMTGHKSKGGEWDVVFHLNPFLIPSKHARKLAETGDDSQLEQERNLRYVIETRPKKELYFIDLEEMA